MEVAPLKNVFFLADLKLEVKDSLGYNKKVARMGKVRKTREDRFAAKVGGWGILRNGGILVMGDYFEMGGS